MHVGRCTSPSGMEGTAKAWPPSNEYYYFQFVFPQEKNTYINNYLNRYMNPQPTISAFREASFGHGQFEIFNATHALWTWHRNDDDVSVASDQIWLNSLASSSSCDDITA